ncbi:growth factor receptor-bound protein 2-like [Watersipora subatra]|uniref:growth factor receptor-bound protein 2-like n=1 Tax=Watersipora subatra TaxID=2589382 RepID=UPI00355B4448
MEAVACHNFNASAEDELSFRKGNIIKVLDVEEDKNWYKAELHGTEGFVPANYIKLRDNPWYHGKITRIDSERLLLEKSQGQFKQPDGAFLLRTSERDKASGNFSLSVKWRGSVQHFKVLRDMERGKYFLWTVKFNSINELIEYHKTSSLSQSENIYLTDMSAQVQYIERVQALFDFQAEEDGEISFKKGDILMVLKKMDPNWWLGSLDSQSTQGLFPSTYVRIL